ncbi:MAG: SusE domain-containing protein [Bacteroidales bacterium]|jgi:hypothetical protein|nr:SusE domain-containing protein [Bacteroidales bacterium]
MKKYVFLLMALLGIGCWACKDDDPSPPKPVILLSAPANASSCELETVDDVTFSWAVSSGEVAGGYTLYLSLSADLVSAKTYTSTQLLLKIASGNLDALLGEWGVALGAEATVYWSVKPSVEGEATPPAESRNVKMKRLPKPAPVISLSEPDAEAFIDLKGLSNINFSWKLGEEDVITGGYTLYISNTEDLASSLTYTSEELSKAVDTNELDEKLEEWGYTWEAEAEIFWTVKPTEPQIATVPDARKIKIKRLPRSSSVLGSMQNVQVYPGYERILVTWEQNPDPMIEQTVLYWNNKADSVVIDFVRTEDGWQKESVYIPNLTEGTAYTFKLFNKNSLGDRSAPEGVQSGGCTPYGPVWEATLGGKNTRELTRILPTAYNPASPNTTVGNVTLTWDNAPANSVKTVVEYKKTGSGTPSNVYVSNNATSTALTQVGNNLLDPDHLLYVKTLYAPEGGIDTLESKTLLSQMVVYIADIEKSHKRLNYNHHLKPPTWTETIISATDERLIWGMNQEDKITVFDCNRFGSFGIFGGAEFINQYGENSRFQMKWTINADNTVTVEGRDNDPAAGYTIHNNDQTRGEGGSSASHGTAGVVTIDEGPSTFNPSDRTLAMNYMRIVVGTTSTGIKTFFLETLKPKP